MFRVKPDTHCVPDEGVEIENVLVLGPLTFGTVGSAERVSAPLLLFVTVIVPDLGLVELSPDALRAGTGPANATDTVPPPPPPVVESALPVKATVLLGLANVEGVETFTVSVAGWGPGVAFMPGRNVTLITHEAPASNVLGQAGVCPYWFEPVPVIGVPMTLSTAPLVLVFVIVSDWDGLIVPRNSLPKSIAFGETV
jgi:hypothetical protein